MIVVNSVHSQAIDRPAEGLAVEAYAEDGTIEAVSAIRSSGTPGFVMGLQWHPEWRFAEHPSSVAIFHAFGEACRVHRQGLRRAA
jgi:putative glutamine amidotransferase